MTRFIKSDECFSQIKVVILDGDCCSGFLFSYFVDLFLEEHLNNKTLFADLDNGYVRFDQINSAFMAILLLPFMQVFEHSSLFWMVQASHCSKTPLFLKTIDELSIDLDDVWLAFDPISLFYALFGPDGIGSVRAVVSHVLSGSRSGHFGNELLLIFHGACDLALKGMFVAEVGLHLPDH